MHTWRLAWRNLWRNPRRTALTAAALGLGVACMAATSDYMDGIFAKMIDATANGRTGHAQIHAPEYRTTKEEERLLPQADAVLAFARAQPQVASAAARLWGSALVAIGDRSRSVQLLGVDPAAEGAGSGWTRQLRQGAFLRPDALGAMDGEIVLGLPLAKRLQVELGARIVVTAADIVSGEARSEMLRVVGLLRTGDGLLDESCAIVLRPVAARLLGVDGGAHEIALRLQGIDAKDRAAVVSALAPIGARFGPAVAAVPWHEVQPMAAEMLGMQDYWAVIFVGMVFAVIAFVIVGTMSMALLERTWEFGLLRALGTAPGRLAALILAESACLALVGALPGALAGHLLSRWLQHVGIDFGEEVSIVVAFTEPIRPVPNLPAALAYAAVFVGLTVLASALAAWRASRIEPAQALRSRG